jgi:hypothetical protein
VCLYLDPDRRGGISGPGSGNDDVHRGDQAGGSVRLANLWGSAAARVIPRSSSGRPRRRGGVGEKSSRVALPLSDPDRRPLSCPPTYLWIMPDPLGGQ